MRKPTFIDLFAGAGGLSEGFIRAGYEAIAHVEMDEAACYTLKTRAVYHYLNERGKKEIYANYLEGKISRAKLYEHVPQSILNSVINLPIGGKNNKTIFEEIDRQLQGRRADLIIGGPPCQAYSLVGRARSETNMANDPRNYLYLEYGRYLKKYQPRMFVFENVLGLRSANGGKYLAQMQRLFKRLNYDIKLYNLEANNFGVLQHRRRIIIIGKRKNENRDFPDLETIKSDNKYKVADLFMDLPRLKAGSTSTKPQTYASETQPYLKEAQIRNGLKIVSQHVTRPHTRQDREIYLLAAKLWKKKRERLNYNDLPERLKTHQNRTSFTDRFKVVAADEPYSHTVVAHIAKDGHYYIHPDIKQNRSISVREAARLQSFPDDYYFEGTGETMSRTAAFKQIGNAVPPLMAEKIALKIKEIKTGKTLRSIRR